MSLALRKSISSAGSLMTVSVDEGMEISSGVVSVR